MNKGVKLKERRKELRLTLKEVAAAVGVAEATVQRWESGNIVNFKVDKIPKLASVLQLPVEELTNWFKKEAEFDEYDMKAEHQILYTEAELAVHFENKYGKDNMKLFTEFLSLNNKERERIAGLLSGFSKLDEIDRSGVLGYIESIIEKLLADPKYSVKKESLNA
jgi:transcriptional regulator with XRE-family HTH domain|nr:MAG TPA: phosphoryltransferase [Caudoviricetes sp.]